MKQDFDAGPQAGEFDFQKAYYFLLEQKWIILGCLAGMVLLGSLYIARTPNSYSSVTAVQVEQEESKFVKIEDINAQDLKQAEVLKTIETNFASPTLLLGVIQSMKLTPAQLGVQPKADGTEYSDNELVEAFSRKVTAKLVRGTRLINITADNASPVLAQQIADAVVKEYIKIHSLQKTGVSHDATNFLMEEAERLKRQLQLSEDEAQAFKDAHPDVALENSQAFLDQKLLALGEKVNLSKEQYFKVESDYAQVKQLMAGEVRRGEVSKLLTVPSVNTDPGVLQLQKSVADAEADLRQLAERYRPKHPKYLQGQAQVASLRSALDKAIVQAAEAVGTALEASRQTKDNFEKDLKLMEAAKLANDKLAIPFDSLKREVEANRDLYESVKLRLKETIVTSAIGSNEIRVVTPAVLPLKPSRPKKALIMIASIMGGLLLGVCAGFGRSMTDTSLKTVDTAEEVLGLPALAAIPVVTGKVAAGKRFLITQDPNNPVSEAFRTLRTSLALGGVHADTKTILFTSSIPGEGKSFCAINYAISLAQTGQRTLLIDGDLRLPTVAKSLLEDDRGNGIQSVLTGKSKFDDSLYPVADIPDFTVLPSGTKISNPAEVLAGDAFGKLLKEAESKFDRIVIDSAPVHAVSDTFLLLKHVHSVCFVVNASGTPSKAVQRACHLLESAGSKPLGIVLNRVSQQGGGYYYSYAGKYGKVYGDTADTGV